MGDIKWEDLWTEEYNGDEEICRHCKFWAHSHTDYSEFSKERWEVGRCRRLPPQKVIRNMGGGFFSSVQSFENTEFPKTAEYNNCGEWRNVNGKKNR